MVIFASMEGIRYGAGTSDAAKLCEGVLMEVAPGQQAGMSSMEKNE
jgi:hypothetical protein